MEAMVQFLALGTSCEQFVNISVVWKRWVLRARRVGGQW